MSPCHGPARPGSHEAEPRTRTGCGRPGPPRGRVGLMGRLFTVSGVLVVAGGVLFALGPTIPVDTDVGAPELPGSGVQGVEDYLQIAESRFNDLVPGTEKKVIWADSSDPQVTRRSLVYLHGFSASRQEVAPLPQLVADSLGANLFLTRLTGHGRSPGAMAEASVRSWLQDAEEAMAVGARVGERVILMGTSTGGTLALWLAAQERWRDRIAGVILISPNLGPRDRTAEVLLWPWGGTIARLVMGSERAFTPRNEEQARFWTERYPVKALLPMMGLVKLVREQDPAGIRAPTLVAYSTQDRVVDASRVVELVPRLGSRQKALLAVQGGEGGDVLRLARR